MWTWIKIGIVLSLIGWVVAGVAVSHWVELEILPQIEDGAAWVTSIGWLLAVQLGFGLVLSPLTVGKSIALRLMTIVMMLPGLITHAFLLVATLPEFHTWTAALMFSTLVWYGAAINLMVGARTKIVEEQLS